MEPMYSIGLDVHQRKIRTCVKGCSGKIYAEGWLPATRMGLDAWMKTSPQPWTAVMRATMATEAANPTHARKPEDFYPRSSRARRESFCPFDKDLSRIIGDLVTRTEPLEFL